MKIVMSLLLLGLTFGQTVKRKSDRELDGFVGPVKKVFVEWSPLAKTNYGIAPGTKCRTHLKLYDEQGREMQTSLFSNSCGEDESRYTRIYDAKGNFTIKEEEFHDPKAPPPPPPIPVLGAVQQVSGPPKAILKYDEKGRRIEKAQYFASGTLSFRIVYVWDEQNRMIEFQAWDADGTMYSRSAYRYEGKQRYPSESLGYGRNRSLSSKTIYSDYKFNAQGDWIERKSTTESSGQPAKASLDIRTIEYYGARK